MDLAPFGYSTPDPNSTYFRDVQAERIATFIDEKKLSRVILVAHSYGGGPATEYVMHHRNKIIKLILIDVVLNVDEVKSAKRSFVMDTDWMRDALIGLVLHNHNFAKSQAKNFVYIKEKIDDSLIDTYTRYFTLQGTTAKLSKWLKDYSNDQLDDFSR